MARIKWTVLAGAVALGLSQAAPAHAALVAYDGFETYTSGTIDQADGPNDLLGKGAATGGWQGAWSTSAQFAGSRAEVVSPGLSYSAGSISISGGSNSLSIRGNFNPYEDRQFTATTGEVYLSFLFQQTAEVSSAYRYLFYLDNDNAYTSVTGRAGVGDLNGNGTTGRRFGVQIVNASGSTTSAETLPYTWQFATGQTYLLVARLSSDGSDGAGDEYDRLELWIDPTSATLGTADLTVNAAMGINTVSYFLFGSTATNNTPVQLIDELRIATDVQSVLGVPEPASLALLAAGGLLAAGSRRTRRR